MKDEEVGTVKMQVVECQHHGTRMASSPMKIEDGHIRHTHNERHNACVAFAGAAKRVIASLCEK